MKFDNQLRYAVTVIEMYKGEIPLSPWLKDYFRQHKQMGSKDRKTVADLIYSFYRLGHALKELPTDKRILIAVFLSHEKPGELLAYFNPTWNEHVHLPLKAKMEMINLEIAAPDQLTAESIFPWVNQLSKGITGKPFAESFLHQPDLFLRIRPGFKSIVTEKLQVQNIYFETVADDCIALLNSTRLHEVLAMDKEAVVQDYSSQQSGEFIKAAIEHEQLALPGNTQSIPVWDACAASGGKSIMAYDINSEIRLTVSDKRESIIHNLHQRFYDAGIKSYTSFIADLADVNADTGRLKPRIIIADLPCSGSGTWSRTPEQLHFFKEEKIIYYSNLQKKILSNLLLRLEKGGSLVYITCSVFKKENEDVVEYLRKTFKLQVRKMGSINGYLHKADTMFAAWLTA